MEDTTREWTGLEFGKFQRAVENRGKWRICGAPTTLAVKGLTMMMVMNKEFFFFSRRMDVHKISK